MNTQFKESFLKDLRGIKDRDLLARVNEIIQTVEQAQTPQEIPTLKKLRGERNYFRIRIGDYRLGLKIEGQRTLGFSVLPTSFKRFERGG